MNPLQVKHRGAGFTLIEVVLAIGLSAVLLGLLTLAVDQYLVNVQASRGSVEHAQVARGVLRMIANDLRNTATRYRQDTSAARQLAGAAGSAAFDVDSVDEQPPDEPAETPAAEPPPPIGVSGDRATIQIDVRRARRPEIAQPEEFAPTGIGAADPAPPTRSGLRRVRYSLAPGGGLVRQEVSRAVALEAERLGRTDHWDAAYRVVAGEVVSLEFRYSDGEEPRDAWDLEESGGANPLAVEVAVTLREPERGDQSGDPTTAPTRRYRIAVAVPTVEETPEGAEGNPSSAEGSATR